MLHAPGNAHDGDAEEKAEGEVNDGNLPPATEDPDEVHYHRYTPGFIGAVNQHMAEGPQCIGAQLKQLHAKGNADDCYAHQQAHDIVDDGDDNATKDEPEYVS